MKNIACSKFWTDLIIRGHLEEITHCCRRTYFHIPLEVLENYKENLFNNHPLIIDERSKMIKTNELTEGCYSCSKSWPNSDWHSWNEWQDKEWSKNELDILPFENKINKIEISFSNKCNFSCMYCGPQYSSTWAKIIGQDVRKSNSIWLETALEALYNFIDNEKKYKFGFIGGEPLLDLEVIDNIKKLIEKINKSTGNQIYIITSLGVKEKTLKNFLNLTEQYSNIDWRIAVSIDSIFENGTIIRDGLNLDLFYKNLDLVLQSDSVASCGFLPTMSALNIKTLKETTKWFIEKQKTAKIPVTIKANAVEQPFSMNPAILPEHYKIYVQDSIDLLENNFKDFKRHLEVIKNKIGTQRTKQNLISAKSWYQLQCKIKNKNYFDLLPELNEILDLDNT